MAAKSIPRRSVLFVPASNARALAKARTLPVDGIIIDLEDAVAPAEKDAARAQAVRELEQGGFGWREVVLRINGRSSPWAKADLAAAAALSRAAGSCLSAVCLVKVERPEDVAYADEMLAADGAPATLRLWSMIETPRGVLAANEIAAASQRLECLVMGTSDLVKDLHARHTRGRTEVLTSLSLGLLAARAHGLAALDGVHLDLDDDEGFAESCRQGADLGFDGKTLIHPKTIEVANRTFTPSDDDVAAARRVIAAYGEAVAAGKGVVVVDGRLVEWLHVEQARRLVALVEAVAARG